MKKISLKPSTIMSPLPAVLVSCGQGPEANIITIGWTGIINSDPAMTYISVRPERHSHDIIEREGEFVINCTTAELAKATDYCGVRSGAKVNKWSDCNLTKQDGEIVKCPMIAESPINIECKVVEKKPLGSHDMFLAEIVKVHVDEGLMTESGRIAIEKAGLLAYAHSCYLAVEKRPVGKFGFSVMKPKTKKRKAAERRLKK